MVFTNPALLFTSDDNFVSKLIRLFTNPVRTMKGEFVPSHVATLLHLDNRYKRSGTYVVEAHYGKGVDVVPYRTWLKHNEGKKIQAAVFQPENGIEKMKLVAQLNDSAEQHEGKEYEDIISMWRIAFNMGRSGKEKLFCSELARFMWGDLICPRESPHDTDPDEIYQYTKKNKNRFIVGKLDSVVHA